MTRRTPDPNSNARTVALALAASAVLLLGADDEETAPSETSEADSSRSAPADAETTEVASAEDAPRDGARKRRVIVGAFDEEDPSRPRVRVWRVDEAVEIEASLSVEFDPHQIWSVVLDYDGLADFMPNVDSSFVLARTGDVIRVRQAGGASFVVRKSYHFELEFRRLSSECVAFRRVAGDLDGYSGEWRVVPESKGVKILYRATLAKGLGAPWFLGRSALHRNVLHMLPAIRKELIRRYGPPD